MLAHLKNMRIWSRGAPLSQCLFKGSIKCSPVCRCLSKGSIKMLPCTSVSFQVSNKIAPPVCPCLYKGLISQCLSKDPIKCSPVCQCLSKGLFSAAPWQLSSISIMSPLSPAPHNQGALINQKYFFHRKLCEF